MTGKVSDMMYRSRIPALLGRKQMEENRVINSTVLAEEAGITRPTAITWLDPENEFTNLNASVAHKFMTYFKVGLGDLVELVPASKQVS